MIGSKTLNLLKYTSRLPITKSRLTNFQQIRHHGGEWTYRSFKEPPKWSLRGKTFASVVLWWWFYWKLYNNWPALIGQFNGEFLPNPRNWTDEELGIPSD